MAWIKRNWFGLLKVAIIALLLAGLGWQLFYHRGLETLTTNARSAIHGHRLLLLVAAVILMPVNWLLEALRWREVVRKIEPMPVGKAFRAVWCGVSLGVFTPNRIGEYAGRIWILKPGNRLKGVLLTLISSLALIVVTVGIGIGGSLLLFFFRPEAIGDIIPGSVSMVSASIFLGAIWIAILLFYFKLPAFSNRGAALFSRWRSNPLVRSIRVASLFRPAELGRVLGLAFLRYSVYLCQYVLLLYTFGADANVLALTATVALLFLLQMGLPVPAIAELGVRGSLAVNLHAWGGTDTMAAALLASTTLWLLNLVVPALIGGWFWWKLKLNTEK